MKTSIPVSCKVIALGICVICMMMTSGCTSAGVTGKYLDTAHGSTSYMQLNPDGTCYLYPFVRDNYPVPGFNCTYTVHGNTFQACYPESNGICDTWTIISPEEISGPAGYIAKKAH
jgi:hypothetical protein